MTTAKKMPSVALVGRTNVGKSTLFNRLVGHRKAIVSAHKNTTRDRNIRLVYWRGVPFHVIDTGGLDIEEVDEIEKGIIKQVCLALEDADLILFMVDAKVGIIPEDTKIAKFLRSYHDKVIVVANKLDKPHERQLEGSEFLALGFGDPIRVSAISGGGTGEMLDVVIGRLSPKSLRAKQSNFNYVSIRVAIVGKPNVGKSSLLNAILGQERVIVSEIPHTTREPIDTELIYKDQHYIIMDTAGIRKRTKIPNINTKKGIDQTLQAIESVDVVLFLVEAQESVSAQDARVAAEILKRGVSIVLVINKWDLIKEKETNTIKEFETYFRSRFAYLKWVPMIFVSAKEKKRVKKILDLVYEVYQERNKTLDAKRLDNFFTKIIKSHRPPKDPNGKRIYIYGISQVQSGPPVFEIRRKGKTEMQEAYVRFIENRIREKFGFTGTPIRIKVRSIA